VLTLSSEAEPQPDGGPQDDEDHSEPCAHPGREEHKEAPAVLVFRDIRKFGRVEFGRGAPPARVTRLGRDAWVGEWGPEYVAACLHGRRAPIKAVLLDQRHLAGIGNIYADEILFAASLSPLREAGGLNEEEVERLAVAIRERLTEGVRARGCSISDFVDTQERPGTYQEVLQAYGRGGEPCARCNGTLQRTVVAGRGTSYCPACQR
jgi:formamidopyrimidine-DNA glycosylase